METYLIEHGKITLRSAIPRKKKIIISLTTYLVRNLKLEHNVELQYFVSHGNKTSLVSFKLPARGGGRGEGHQRNKGLMFLPLSIAAAQTYKEISACCNVNKSNTQFFPALPRVLMGYWVSPLSVQQPTISLQENFNSH